MLAVSTGLPVCALDTPNAPDSVSSPAAAAPAVAAPDQSLPATGDSASPVTDPSGIKSTITSLDQKILLECIELARFNLHFHDGVNRKNFAQEWLYPMQREAGTALNFSSTLVDIRQRSRGLQNTALISSTALKKGLECAVVGSAITGTSSAVQLLQNINQTRKATAKGYSPKDSIATVQAYSQKIDALLGNRQTLLLNAGLGDEAELYDLQGRLLNHMKNQLIFEFKTWSEGSRFLEWSERTFYTLDATQGFTQMGAGICSLQGFTNRPYTGAGAVTGIVSNAIVTVNPIVRTAVGHTIARVHRNRLNKIFPQTRPLPIDQLMERLQSLKSHRIVDQSSSLESQELAFLIRRSEAMDEPLNREIMHVTSLRRIADQQAISGPLIGMSGATRAILNTVAYNQPVYARAAANRINLSGRIVQSTGQAYSLFTTPYTEIKHYFYKRHLEKTNTAPKQILAARLSKLDELEKRIVAAQFYMPKPALAK